MSSEPQDVEKPKRKISPLFPNQIEGKGYIYAEELGRVDLYWQPAMTHTSRRIRIPEEMLVDPDTRAQFEINFFETSDRDLHRILGGGDFYIEPHGLDQKMMSGGRPLNFGGPTRVPYPKTGSQAANQPTPETSETAQNPFASPPRGEAMLMEMMREFRDEVREEMRERSRGQESTNAAQEMTKVVLAKDQSQVEVVQALRAQLDKQALDHAKALDELIRAHRDDQTRRDQEMARERATYAQAEIDRRREIDGIRDEYRTKSRSLDLQDEERRANSRKDQEVERHRYEKMLDDLETKHRERINQLRVDSEQRITDERERRIREVTESTKGVEDRIAQATSRHERRARDIEKDLEDTRTRLNAEIDRLRKERLEFEKENIELRQELADRPEEPGDPPPPPPPSIMTASQAPWWAAIADKYGPGVVSWLQKNAVTQHPGVPMQTMQPAQMQAPQQFRPHYQQMPVNQAPMGDQAEMESEPADGIAGDVVETREAFADPGPEDVFVPSGMPAAATSTAAAPVWADES